MNLACPDCGRLNSEFDPRCLDCGTPLPTSTSDEKLPLPVGLGGRLDRFEILGELGRGGMGVVYKARDLELGREVALKLLAGGGDRGGGDREKVLREARAVAALDHPAIGTLYEVGTAPAGSFLVLAFYEGRTLATELEERGALPPHEALGILCQLASALAAAHAAGILHRDIKPSNVFRLPDGRIKLLDFGIAQKAADSLEPSTLPVGTAAYMAPERLRGQESGRAGDIFSLGIVGWEVLTGSYPFARAEPGWRRRLEEGDLSAAEPLPTSLPPKLVALLLSCLQGEARERPSAAELAEGLDVQRAEMPPHPPRSLAASVFVFAFVGLFVAAALLLLTRQAPKPRVLTLLEPQIDGTLADGDRERLGANLEATSWRTLSRLEGIEVLDRNLARQAKGDPAAVLRATAADESIFWLVHCPGTDLCAVTLQRHDAAGHILGNESLELSAASDTLSARAAAAALRRLYRELPAKEGAPEPELGLETYQHYLSLRAAIDRRQIAPDAALEELAVIRREAPPLPELNALEAGICRFLFARDRNETWLERGLQTAGQGLEISPGDPVLLATRFDLLLEARQHDAAAAALEVLAGSGAGLADVLIRRARLAEAQGRAKEALALLERLVKDRPAAYFLQTLANLELRLGRTDDARGHLVAALGRAPANAQVRSQLASLDVVAGRLEEAAESWRLLSDEEPGLDNLNNFGLVLMLSRRYQEAEPVFRRALELDSFHAETRLNLADTLLLLGRQEEAFALYHELVAAAVPRRRDDWRLEAVLAQAYAHLGENALAYEAMARSLDQAPESGEAAFSAALVSALLGDAEKALEEARRASAAGSGKIWFELPFFDTVAQPFEAAGLRQKVEPHG